VERSEAAVGVEFPTGVVTLVFTDVEGSSGYWERHGATFQPVLEFHNRIIRECLGRSHGFEVRTQGDAFFAAFAAVDDAFRFAVDAQLALVETDWQQLVRGIVPVRVRIGIHCGEALIARHPGGDWDYFGPVVNRAARVADAAHGGQVLVSECARARAVAGLPPELFLADLGLHRLRGVGEEHLWQLSHSRLPHHFPPPRSLSGCRHNLPVPAAPYVGRDELLIAWAALLREPQTRLLTLVGPAGIGKTRSALHLAELSAADHPDGVWWVELAETSSDKEMLDRIAAALEIDLDPRRGVAEQIAEWLRPRRALIVLDNTEQIPDASTVVSDLLRAAPGSRLLATSRRALELRAERRIEIPSLPSPEAQALFLDRAQARESGFILTEENSGDVVELCRRLEGVPLAIELAASRIVAMTPREILGRLDERFRLLHARTSDLPDRHRALRTAIAWSYDLLSAAERSLFAQLSVFVGGFTLDAAEAVCDVPDVLEGVEELRRHSLLGATVDAASQRTRMAMLETVRAYASEKLEASPGLTSALRDRHAEHFLGFAEARARRMRTDREEAALGELTSDIDNLRAAIAWLLGSGADDAARLALALYRFLFRRGRWVEARDYLQAALRPAARLSGAARHLHGAILFSLGDLARSMGDRDAARLHGEASLALRRELGQPGPISDSLNLMAILAVLSGDTEHAEHLSREALALLDEDDHGRRGSVLNSLAGMANLRKDYAVSQNLYEEALRHRRAMGDVSAVAETLNNLGALAHNSGDRDGARTRYHESLALRRSIGDSAGIAVLLNNLGELAEEAGDFESAIPLFLHSARIFRELRSGHAAIPATASARIQMQLSPARWEELTKSAEAVTWEAILP
jgi:predicted ATPase/class 3 adenylate cyclase